MLSKDKKNKNVCMFTTVHQPFDTRIFYKECKALVGADYNVTLIAQHDKDETVEGVQIIALPKTKSRFSRMFYLSVKVFWITFKQKADIYHFHDPELIPVGVMLKCLRKKVIYDVHEDYPKSIMSKHYIPEVLKKFIATFINIVQNLFLQLFDYIIVAGDDIAETFFNINICNKLITLKNVPSIEFLTACNCNNSTKRDNKITYVGVLSSGRGIKEIVEAMNYVRNNVKLFLIGSFVSSEFEIKVRKIANERVHFVGKVHYKEVPGIIKTMKIGLICFHSDPNNIGAISGRNNKLYEYMAGGLAIVASNFPKWTEVIEGGTFGITVNPKNPRDIASAIDYLLERPELLKQISENGINAIRERYNWDIEKEKLLQIYDKMIKL